MKNCTPLWQSTFRSQNVQSTLCSTPSWCEAHLQVKTVKAPHADARTTFGRSDVVLRGRRKGLCTFPKVGKKVRVLWQFQKRWQAWDI